MADVTPRIACSYERVSSPEQLKDDGIKRQTHGTNALCAAKRWTLDETLSGRDLGISAYHGANATEGALSKILDAITKGIIKPRSVIVVENLVFG